ncbi:uncharacterized protein [Heptranchias perlo]|uniref:uncharacterized protein n=1 Tax=Heptranchias perlo TaxID=212740 RepID=UPI00355A1E26
MEVKPKDYTFPKESNSVFHLTREHLELLVIWSHCHGNQCTFTPTWREIVEEHQNGVLAILWECEAGHSYHWWTGGVCQLPCEQDKPRGQLPSKSKQLEDVLASAVQIKKTHRIKTTDGDLFKETDSFDGSCKTFLPADIKAVRNGASVSQIPSTHHSWRETMFGGDRGKLGVSGTMGESQASKKPDTVYIKTEKEETSDFNNPCEIKDENRSQNRELKKYHLGNSSLVAEQSTGHNIPSTDACNVSNGYRKRSSSVTDDRSSGSSLMPHCNNGKVHIAELHHSPHAVSRGSCLTGSLVESTMKPSDVSGQYYIGSTKLANHDRSGANLGPLLDSEYIRPITHNRINSDIDNPELQCDPPVPCGQEGVLEFLHTILKADVVDEVFSNVRLANETDIEVLTENLSGKEVVLLDSGIQANARLYFSAGGWAAVSATLEVLGGSGQELMIMNPYQSCNMLNAEAMDEEQIVVAHVPALLPSADDKKRKVKYPVTKGEIRRRIIPPEKMSKTVIKSYLRLRRDNRFDIRQLLDLPVTGYDRTLHTSFTRLCEGEAKTLTENFHQLNLGYFPVDECASTIAEHAAASEIYAARKVIEDLDSIMENFMWQEHPYNLITHGFGPQNIKVVLDLVKLLLRESLRKTSS